MQRSSRISSGANRASSEQGYAMAALLVTLAIMAVLSTAALPTWRHEAKREREAELIFRAGQYVHAIELFKRKYANQYPPNIETLVKQKFLRKAYKDPMTKNGEWRIVTPAELQGAPMGGVPSTPQPGQGRSGGNSPFSRPAGSAGQGPSSSGFGSSSQGQGPGSGAGSSSSPGSQPSGPGQSDTAVRSSFSGDSGGRTVNMGPMAAVASKSQERSIRIFKGRDRYDQWIVTIDDVMRRQTVSPQSPNQPGQPGGTGSQFPGSGLRPPSSSSPPRP